MSYLEWIQDTFIPEYFAVDYYNNKRLHWRNRRFQQDLVNYRVGPARFRQLRVPKRNIFHCNIKVF